MAEETPQMKAARVQAEKQATHEEHDWPRDGFGTPMVKIQAAASELVPTVQYGNITVGPVVVTRFVPIGDGTPAVIAAAIRETQSMCENAVAEDRQTVQALFRKSKSGRADG